MEDEGLSGTTLIMLNNIRGIVFAIDGLAGKEDGLQKPVKKIRVLSETPHYLGCMLSGSLSNGRRAVTYSFKRNMDLFKGNGRLTVEKFADTILEFWVDKLKVKLEEDKNSKEKPLEVANSTVAIGGFDRVGDENVSQMWAVEYKPPNPPEKVKIVDDFYFSGSGKELAIGDLKSYTVEMTMGELTRRVKDAMLASSRPYPKNAKGLELQHTGGLITIQLINPNNENNVFFTAPLDDIVEEMIKLCDQENNIEQLENKKREEEEETSGGGSGSSTSKGNEEKGKGK